MVKLPFRVHQLPGTKLFLQNTSFWSYNRGSGQAAAARFPPMCSLPLSSGKNRLGTANPLPQTLARNFPRSSDHLHCTKNNAHCCQRLRGSEYSAPITRRTWLYLSFVRRTDSSDHHDMFWTFILWADVDNVVAWSPSAIAGFSGAYYCMNCHHHLLVYDYSSCQRKTWFSKPAIAPTGFRLDQAFKISS